MTSTILPYFCEVCESILPMYNMESLTVSCRKCHEMNKMSDSNRIVAVMTYGSTARVLQPSELKALSNVPTTQRIKKDCPSCGFGVMAITVDENYTCNYVCIKCHTALG